MCWQESCLSKIKIYLYSGVFRYILADGANSAKCYHEWVQRTSFFKSTLEEAGVTAAGRSRGTSVRSARRDGVCLLNWVVPGHLWSGKRSLRLARRRRRLVSVPPSAGLALLAWVIWELVHVQVMVWNFCVLLLNYFIYGLCSLKPHCLKFPIVLLNKNV